jgi:hypothetical protein
LRETNCTKKYDSGDYKISVENVLQEAMTCFREVPKFKRELEMLIESTKGHKKVPYAEKWTKLDDLFKGALKKIRMPNAEEKEEKETENGTVDATAGRSMLTAKPQMFSSCQNCSFFGM